MMKKNPYYYVGVNPTVDLVIINTNDEVLLIKRSRTSEACPGMYALPGGFIDSSARKGDSWERGLETPKEAALRELKEETNLILDLNSPLIFIGEYEGNNRDPRDNKESWSKSYAFFYKINLVIYNEQKKNIRGMDDAEEARWVPIAQALKMSLAFDHHIILENSLLFNN